MDLHYASDSWDVGVPTCLLPLKFLHCGQSNKDVTNTFQHMLPLSNSIPSVTGQRETEPNQRIKKHKNRQPKRGRFARKKKRFAWRNLSAQLCIARGAHKKSGNVSTKQKKTVKRKKKCIRNYFNLVINTQQVLFMHANAEVKLSSFNVRLGTLSVVNFRKIFLYIMFLLNSKMNFVWGGPIHFPFKIRHF